MDQPQLKFCRTCVMAFVAVPQGRSGYMHKNCCSLCANTGGRRHTLRCMNRNMGLERYNELQREARRLEENRRNLDQQWNPQYWLQRNWEAQGWVQYRPADQVELEQEEQQEPEEVAGHEQEQEQEAMEVAFHDEHGNRIMFRRD
eukprot:5546655-Heterocapsa_arctica.AAC.1